VDGGDRTDVGALLHVRVDVDPQVRVFSIVAVAAGLHLAVDRMLDDLAGGGLVAVRLDGQRIVEGPGPVGGEVGTRVGLGADARCGSAAGPHQRRAQGDDPSCHSTGGVHCGSPGWLGDRAPNGRPGGSITLYAKRRGTVATMA